MAEVNVNLLVEGGKATAGPPLGPTLAPLKVNIGQVVASINEKTKAYAGLKVPVKVVVNKETKEFTVEVGSPSTGELIKKELGISLGRKGGEGGTAPVGNLKLAQAVKIAQMKTTGSLAKGLKNGVREIMGTCVSLGVTVEGKDPREILKEIEAGKHNSLFTG